MRALLIVLAAPLLLATSSCAAVSAIGSIPAAIETVSNVGNTVQIRGIQALIVAEETYQGVNRVAKVAVQSGRLNREQLLRVQALNNQILGIFEKAKTVADEDSKAKLAAQALSLALELRSIVL